MYLTTFYLLESVTVIVIHCSYNFKVKFYFTMPGLIGFLAIFYISKHIDIKLMCIV